MAIIGPRNGYCGRGGGHRASRIITIVGVAAVACLIARSASASIPGTVRGVPECRILAEATTTEYLAGIACPPDGFEEAFGYRPVLVETPFGWRYSRPGAADGGCSGPLADTGAFWDFTDPCRAHDYGYDLTRLGVADRAEADALLYRDMMESCRERGPFGTPACKTFAESAHAVLRIGDVSGFDPAPVPLG